MEFFTASGNVPFSIALGVVLLMGGLEVLSLLFGGASSLIGMDGPDVPHDVHVSNVDTGHFDAGHVHTGHVDVAHAGHGDMAHDAGHGDADVHGDVGVFGQILAWLHMGQMPVTVLAMLFLLAFGVSGLGLQNILNSTFNVMLPASVAIWPAGIVALLATRVCGGLLKPILPREETQAVSSESFVGCAARINIGTARPGKPAEARVVDKYGHTHYVMVEPEHDEEFKTGSAVLIIKRREHIYRVIDNTGGEV
jgi:hypothetical protein